PSHLRDPQSRTLLRTTDTRAPAQLEPQSTCPVLEKAALDSPPRAARTCARAVHARYGVPAVTTPRHLLETLHSLYRSIGQKHSELLTAKSATRSVERRTECTRTWVMRRRQSSPARCPRQSVVLFEQIHVD